jgi:hypothetical protein
LLIHGFRSLRLDRNIARQVRDEPGARPGDETTEGVGAGEGQVRP